MGRSKKQPGSRRRMRWVFLLGMLLSVISTLAVHLHASPFYGIYLPGRIGWIAGLLIVAMCVGMLVAQREQGHDR